MKTYYWVPALFLLTGWLVYSCQDLGNAPPPGYGSPTNGVSYAQIQQIFTSSCATSSCHSSTSLAGGLALTAYGSWNNATGPHADSLIVPNHPELSYLVTRINAENGASPMPQSGLMPLTNRNLIEQWIAEGADSVGGGGGGGGNDTVAYAQVQQIFTASCATASCHSGTNPTGGLALTAYGSWNNATGPHADSIIIPNHPELSFLVMRINASGGATLMPASGSLPQVSIDLVELWISQGADSVGGGGGGGGSGGIPDSVSTIFQANCNGCHGSPASPNYGDLDLTTYAAVMDSTGPNAPVITPFDAQNSYLVKKIEGLAPSGDDMPPPPTPLLSLSLITTIRNWIDAGALPDTSGGGSDSVSYAQDIQPLFNQRCISCHPAPEQSDLDLTSYNGLMYGEEQVVEPGNHAASKLWQSLLPSAEERMPQDGPPYLTQGQIDMIAQWIDEGALNN